MIRIAFDRFEANYVFAKEKRYFVTKQEILDLRLKRIADDIKQQQQKIEEKYDLYKELKRLAEIFEIAPPLPIRQEMPEINTMMTYLHELMDREDDTRTQRFDLIGPVIYRDKPSPIISLTDSFFYVDALCTGEGEPMAYLFPEEETSAEFEEELKKWNPILDCILCVCPPAHDQYRGIIKENEYTPQFHRFIQTFPETIFAQAINYGLYHLFTQ